MGGPSSTPKSLSLGPLKADHVFINLGRTGDAIQSLPMAYLHWKKTGTKSAYMVARQFSSFLEGVSYVIPEIWDGDWQDIPGAKGFCKRRGYKKIVIAQIYGRGIKVGRATTSFILESWHQVGMLKEWGAPLVFDQRNMDREAKLASKLPTDKPVVLVAADGQSSPFHHRNDLLQSLKDYVGEKAHIVDLVDYQTPYFHDFLGLFDRACCLVTIDTGFGQLACASKIPVCALVADKPSTWHSSPQRPQHIAYIRYNEWPKRKLELLKAVMGTIEPYGAKPTIYHVWTGSSTNEDSVRRHNVAAMTWAREAGTYGKWVDCRVTEDILSRSAQDFGDPAQLPYIHDMMDLACSKAAANDILLITNADISLVPGMAHEISRKCTAVGSAFCYRWDFPRIITHITRKDISSGQWYVGADLFACTKEWWMKHRANLPPFVIGRECWDWVFRKLIEITGGSEIPQGIYHEKHTSQWEVNRKLAGNLHNRSYARAWLTHHKIDLAEIKNEPHFSVEWPVMMP